ncbi:MAG: ATP-dependent Clp protease ATP-binding subunit [Thermodesulfovibrionales bacterium]
MRELSIGAKIAWKIAAMEAEASKHQFIEAEHIFIGICSLGKVLVLSPEKAGLNPQEFKALKDEYAILQDLMKELGLDMAQLRRRMRKQLGRGDYDHVEKAIHRSEACKSKFDFAKSFVESDEEVTSLHLLAAIWEEPMRQTVLVRMERIKLDREMAMAGDAGAEVEEKKGRDESATPFLDRYGRDLNKAAREGKLGPFVGRRNELLQVIQTLARSMKNNPVLVGEAGVGKTAVVEALALRAVQGKDSQVLGGKRIIELNMGTLVGGTKYRGEFEERLTKIIEEASSNSDIIIFIDEIHNLVGAGQGSGSMDAANIMKPALARGEIKCIGATTISEYRKYIESDPALERRFEKIIVNEPTRDEAIEILKGLRPKWEKHFNKKITDKALEAAVDLSIRFDTDHFLPDKAVDLVDKAGARMQVPFLSMMQPGKGVEIKSEGKSGYAEVTESTIAQVLSDKINVPLEIIAGHIEGKESRLLELNSFLKKRIIGQDEAIDKVSQRLLLAHTGIGKKTGPLAVLLFLGPTGVGKTETAKSLSEFLFGSQSNLIRMDMSEFMEEHSVSKLIGSPPGYVGYDEEGQLTGKLRTKPYSVVLLDEIEKAHPKIFDIFLQVFDEGRITDSKGRTVDARNIIFIMTSNLGHTEQRKKGIGFLEKDEESKHEINSEIKKLFRPELINRIDEQIVFKPLGEDNVREILKTILNEISADVAKRYNTKLKITGEAERFISQEGYSPEYGVRELRRIVEKLVQIPLSNLILSGQLKEHQSWQVVCKGEGISIRPVDS